MVIGFNTGFINHKLKIPLKEILTLYSTIGSDAIEINFHSYEELVNFELDEELINLLSKFSYVSFHAPSKDIIYGDNEKTKKIKEKIDNIKEKINLKAVVIHPSSVDDFSVFDNNLFLIENMDKFHEKFIKPEKFSELKEKNNVGFVLDLQHVYEHGSSMSMAREFLGFLGESIKEMHVSGMTKDLKHSLVHCSDNKEAISSILKLGLDIPIILEGCVQEPFEENAKKELEYIRSLVS